jgi:hypothetical protein
MAKTTKKTLSSLLLFLVFFVVIVLLVYSTSFLRKITVFNHLKHNIPVGEIHGDIQIGQTFLADYDGLSGIDVLMATYNRKNTGECIFHLKDDINRTEDLFSREIDISQIKDNTYFNFKFPKIRHSKGKKIYFYIEAPYSQPGNAITIWSNSKDTYKEGEKIVNGVASEGDLAFKTKYRPGLKSSFDEFLGKITQNKPSPLNKKSFYVVLILLFIFGASLFLTLITKFFLRI